MKSLAFPDMLSGSSLKTLSDREATISNLKLLLKSRKRELFGDPQYGTNVYSLLFEQSSYLLIDIIKDEIFTDIIRYMPQLQVKREDITLEFPSRSTVTITIQGKNILNGTNDLYSISLIENGD